MRYLDINPLEKGKKARLDLCGFFPFPFSLSFMVSALSIFCYKKTENVKGEKENERVFVQLTME